MLSATAGKGPKPALEGWTWRSWAGVFLALAGFGVLAYYSLCDTECRYLRGDILGVDLKILGYVFLSLVLLFIIRKDRGALGILLAAALGVEGFLVFFQVREEVFCPWCLAFALVVLLLFAVNYERPSRWEKGYDRLLRSLGEVSLPEIGIRRFPLWVPAGLGFALVFLSLTGVSNPPEGLGRHVPVFGRGPVEVRLYTDYFCRPCQALEPRIYPLLEKLIHRYRIRFVQVPHHSLTDRYFYRYLAAVNGGAGFARALEIRQILFQCAAAPVDEAVLDRVFQRLGIAMVPYDTSLTMAERDWMLRDDKVVATPTLVVLRPGSAVERHRGLEGVEKALRDLLEG